MEELCHPHLVLAHVGRDDGLALREVAHRLDHVLHTETALLRVGQREALLPRETGLHPFSGIELAHERNELFKNELGVTAHEHIRLQHLAFFGGVDVDVHLDGVLTEHFKLTGNAVVPAATDGENQIAVEHGLVRIHGAVHAEHAERKLVIIGEGAEAEHGAADRSTELFGEFLHLAAGPADHGAVAHEQQRLLGILEVFGGLLDALGRGVRRDLVAGQVHLVGKRCGAGACGHVLRKVDEHGARTAGARDVEGFLHDAREVVGILHEVGVFHGRERHAARVAFLEGVLAEVRGRRLGGEHHDRARIHEGGVDAGERVGCTRAARHEGDADLARLAGVAVGHVGRTLFMAGEDYLNIRVENCVEHRDGGTTRIAENGVDAFAFEAFDNHFGTAQSLVCHKFSCLIRLIFKNYGENIERIAKHGNGLSLIFRKICKNCDEYCL